jgi:SCY1-like protein 1
LIFEVFNGTFNGGDQAGQTKNIPPSMHSSYKRLTNANPKPRLSVAHFLEQGSRNGSFFDTPLIKLTDGIENLGVKSEEEREAFLECVFDFSLARRLHVLTLPSDLEQLTDDFPEDFFKMKVLPELLKSVEFGGGGPKAFSLVMKIATKLPSEDFDTRVTPVLIRLFGNPDRAIRVCLLDNLPLMIDRLSQKVVNDRIFPQIVSSRPVCSLRRESRCLPSLGYWIYRCCTSRKRTDVKICPHNHHKAFRPDHQRRVAEILGQDRQR